MYDISIITHTFMTYMWYITHVHSTQVCIIIYLNLHVPSRLRSLLSPTHSCKYFPQTSATQYHHGAPNSIFKIIRASAASIGFVLRNFECQKFSPEIQNRFDKCEITCLTHIWDCMRSFICWCMKNTWNVSYMSNIYILHYTPWHN